MKCWKKLYAVRVLLEARTSAGIDVRIAQSLVKVSTLETVQEKVVLDQPHVKAHYP